MTTIKGTIRSRGPEGAATVISAQTNDLQVGAVTSAVIRPPVPTGLLAGDIVIVWIGALIGTRASNGVPSGWTVRSESAINGDLCQAGIYTRAVATNGEDFSSLMNWVWDFYNNALCRWIAATVVVRGGALIVGNSDATIYNQVGPVEAADASATRTTLAELAVVFDQFDSTSSAGDPAGWIANLNAATTNSAQPGRMCVASLQFTSTGTTTSPTRSPDPFAVGRGLIHIRY